MADKLIIFDTYLERQLGSKSTPGALVEGWRLTL